MQTDLELGRIPLIAVIALSLAALYTDLRWRRIPNGLTVGSALSGVAFHAACGARGGSFALWGIAVGLAVFLPAFLLGGMGGGDVKLMAALGAWLGAWIGFRTALFTACWGGAIALVLLFFKGGWRRIPRVWHDIRAFVYLRERVKPDTTAPAFAYSVAIALGVLTVLLQDACS